MSVVVERGSEVAVEEIRRAVPAKASEGRTERIIGLISGVEAKHAERVKAQVEVKEVWRVSQERRRLELAAKRRRRERAVFD